MEALLTYLWKPAVIILIFYGFYRFILQKETYFQTNRYFLLSGIVLAIVLPLIIIPIYIDIESSLLTPIIPNKFTTNSNMHSESSVNWVAIASYIYLIVTITFLIRLVNQFLSLGVLILKNDRVKVGNYFYVETESETSPFSFFNYIVYNPTQFTQNELDQILAHEKAHVNQHHSFDTLISNLLTALQWFNPFAWLYKKEMEQNLEFIADDLAQKNSYSQRSYQQLLLKTSIPQYQMALANNFYNSLLKKRIIMLHKTRSNRKSQWKIALITPLLLAFVFTFNTKIIAQKKKVKKELIEINVELFELLISKESSEDDLKEITKTFAAKGLNVKFNGIKRNNKDEITAIKIDAKASNGKASASYSSDNDEGINPIQISFDNENNNLSIGSSDGGHGANYFFSDKGHNKIMKHRIKGKGEHNVFTIHEDDDDHLDTKIWINKDGDTTKLITKKVLIEIDKDQDSDEEHEIHIEIDDDGKEVKTEVIKIKSKKGDGKGNLVFISEDDDDDKNTITTYIVNGKEMSKEEFKKLDTDKIKTIEIKKEVKKKK